VLAAILTGLFLFYLTLITGGVSAGSTDWAMYVMHARNLLRGAPYGATLYVYQPEAAMYGAASYPSGYSLLLAPVYAAFGLNFRAFKIVTDLVLALSLLPIYWYTRRHLGAPAGWLFTIVLGLSFPFTALQDQLGSDGLYLLLSFSAMVTLLGIYDKRKDERSPWLWGSLAGLLAAAAAITRPVGFALVVAVVAREVLRHKRLTRFAVAYVAAFLTVIVLNNLLAYKDVSYAEQFVLSIPKTAGHLFTYVKLSSYLFVNPSSNGLRYVLWAGATLLAAAGILTTLRAIDPLPLLYSAAMLGVLGLYWVPNARYLAPVLPIYLLYVAFGLKWLAGRLPRRVARAAQAAGVAVLLVAPTINAVAIRHQPDTLITEPSFQSLSEYMRLHTGERELTVFWNARVLALASDRPVSSYPRVLRDNSDVTAEAVLRYLDRVRPSYVVLDDGFPADERRLAEAIALAPARFPTIYYNERFRLMRYVTG
jgi:hypothetical protein